jgi:hypothetical protein
MRKELLLEKCNKHFEFLGTDFGFKSPVIQADDSEIQLLWLSGKTGVELVFDRMENCAYLYIHQLHNGKLIQDEDEDEDQPLTYFSIEDILEIRAPETVLSTQGPVAELSGPQLDENLQELKHLMSKYCKDMLSGDFQFFSTLEAVERMRRSPDSMQ